jgi:hypothetical protein
MRSGHDTARYVLTLSFDELTLIYKSLLAAKSLGVLSQNDEFVDDTIQLVDQVLSGEAVV